MNLPEKITKSKNPNQLSKKLKQQGLTQKQIYDAYMQAIDLLIDKENTDQEIEKQLDKIRETLDGICGFCHPSCWLFPETKKRYYPSK